MSGEDHDEVLALRVAHGQLAFVDPIADVFATTALHRENFIMNSDGSIVGFFQIDSTSGAQVVDGHLSLHEVQVDAAHQGRGFARQFVARLPAFLKARYPDWSSVCLTVNCRNKSAYRVYQLGGFVDTGGLYHQGRSGPQHIMTMSFD